MARLLLFNPENDVRLGETPGRTPRKLTQNVLSLMSDGALLPMWWAEDGDSILVRENQNPDIVLQAERMRSRFGLKGSPVFNGEKAHGTPVGEPWGWSYDSVRALTAAGANCPSQQEVDRMRQLSHRRTASEIAAQLADMLPFPIPEPATECSSTKEVEAFLAVHNGGFVKTPWSSSGRGVMKLMPNAGSRDLQNIEAAIRRQGSVMCERILDGICDFAMLFRLHEGEARYMGLSVFSTSGGTAYSGNLIAPEAALEATLIAQGAKADMLDAVRQTMQQLLTEIVAPYYSGWVGVDMMLLADGSLAPCIELNLRMTMGVVAWHMARKLPASMLPCRYSVGPARSFSGGISATCANQPDGFAFNLEPVILQP